MESVQEGGRYTHYNDLSKLNNSVIGMSGNQSYSSTLTKSVK